MPSLPQQPQLPATATPETPEGRWITSFVKSFQQLYFQLTYVLNTMCRVDTLANRPATPTLNETFFIPSNTSQLYAAVSDAWVNVGPRRGLPALGNGASSVTITLSPAEADASYIVTAMPTYATTAYAVEANKAATQFVLTLGRGAGASDSVNWVLWRA